MNAPDPSTYSSGAGYGVAVNSDVDAQISRVFDQAGVDGKSQSNASVGAQGQNLGPSPAASFKMSGGKRHRSKKNKKGGFWGGIINQAVVPLTLLGLNQSAKRMKKR